jgi:uncharacterized protein (TIGR02118 family)
MLKVTVLYGHPTNPDDFEKYYEEIHAPIASSMKGVLRFELTKFSAGPDGSPPAYYRMAELYFTDQNQMQRVMASPEGRATVADIANFATGGATVLVGLVEE